MTNKTSRWTPETELARRVFEARLSTMLDLAKEAKRASLDEKPRELHARLDDLELEIRSMKARMMEDWPWDRNGRERRRRR